MRVAIGGLYHESNTFIERPTTAEDFASAHLHYDRNVLTHWRGTCSEIGGFIEGAGQFGFEAVPTMMAWGMPSGTVSAEAFERLLDGLIARLAPLDSIDGILLSLHGAMVAEGCPGADGEVLRRVRECAGPGVPVVATVDYHANLGDEMVRLCDAIIAYDTYPHIDQAERGREAASILHQVLQGTLKPRTWLARRPLLPHILRQTTEAPPMRDVMALAHEWERRPGIVSVSVCAGFPYADVPDAGFSVIGVSHADPELARRAAEDVAEFAWARRTEFDVRLPSPEEAVRTAMRETGGLVVLADVSDNVGGGTPGDGTVLLRELIRQHAQEALVLLRDGEAVAACIAAGVGRRVRVCVGGKSDRSHGEPVVVEGCVRILSDGIFRNVGPMRDGVLENQGRTAVIDADGILVALTERRMPMWNLQQLRSLGIEPARLRIVVVKGAVAHRAAYGPIARRLIEVDTPGLAAADVRRFTYRRLRRPIYPLDPS